MFTLQVLVCLKAYLFNDNLGVAFKTEELCFATFSLTICGVIKIMSSVLLSLVVLLWNNLPIPGRFPRIGTLFTDSFLSVFIIPPITIVWLFLHMTCVFALLLLRFGVELPPRVVYPKTLEIFGVISRNTSSLPVTEGVTSSEILALA